ncbi:alpha/beta hydrolase [Streptomyces sp. NPDC012888]|uniref:alpha/beta hydrolase n=1 Tax=Streptomyces sp. NPDC012888 TaxID=3364855 RepID=UPI0036AAE1FE
MRRSRTAAVPTAAACALLAALVAPPAGPAQRERPASPAGPAERERRADGPALERFYGQRLRWGDCPDRSAPAAMRCATLTVPLDYADPAKGTLPVAVAKIPATGSKRLGAVVLNFGGPGASGITTLAGAHKTFADLAETHDLVTFDPRGVGRSRPISCGGSLRPQGPVGPDAASQLAALREVAARCAAHSGPVLPYIGTIHVSRDLDVLRQALGQRRLDYLGFSYGTRLAAVYATQFPRRTGRMVLDGVDTLTEPLVEQALASARGQQQALDNFLTWCAHQRECVYGSNTRTAKQQVNALVDRLDIRPLTGGDGSLVTGRDVTVLIANALYSRATWPGLARGLRQAERNGDPTALLTIGEASPEAEPSGEHEDEDGHEPPADNADAALIAVNCADDPDRSKDRARPEAVEREVEALREQFLKASPIFGPLQLMTVLACYGRPPGTDFIRRIDRPGAPRMLLVGTRGDPATPYQWTEETARRLGSAVILDYKGDGHTGYASSACVRQRVQDFLTTGRLPAGTQSCPGED